MDELLDFDRSITLLLNGSDSTYIDNVIMYITGTLTWIPMAVVLLIVLYRNTTHRNFFLLLLMLGLCIFFADQMASGISKPYFKRFRPTQDPSLAGMIDMVNNYRGGLYGFFSSHAANTFSLFTFFSLYFRNKYFTLALLSWTLLNGYSRVYLGVHYVGDVMVGFAWGAIVGFALYKLYVVIAARYNNKGKALSVPTPPNPLPVVAALLATYLYIVIASLF